MLFFKPMSCLSLSLSQACRLAAAIFDRNDFAALGNPSDAKTYKIDLDVNRLPICMLHLRCAVRSHPHAGAVFVVQLPLKFPRGKGASALEIKCMLN